MVRTQPLSKEEQKAQFNEAVRNLARQETKLLCLLRAVLLCLLLLLMIGGATWAYRYTMKTEKDKFEEFYITHGLRIIESFHDAIELRLSSIGTLATSVTSHALATNTSFPFVTMPDFELRGADVRVQANALIVHWMPLVYDKDREEWEEYAMGQRQHINDAFQSDAFYRQRQDEFFGLNNTLRRELEVERNETILADGSGYHPRIWSNGAVTPRGDEPAGSGPYLPVWQRSPVNKARQTSLNINFANTLPFQGVLEHLLESKQAIMNRAVVPTPFGRERLRQNLALSQFRHDIDSYLNDPVSFFGYPVFDSFGEGREIAGVLATNVYWRRFFNGILPEGAVGFTVVLENAFDQMLSYQIDGSQVKYLGEGDHHDQKYDYLELLDDVNSYAAEKASPETRSYTTVPLSTDFGRYRLRIYPSQATEDELRTTSPWFTVLMVVVVFLVTSVLFVAFVVLVERRQRIVMDKVIELAAEAAEAEQDYTEFLAHECRNPLSAAMIAHNFVKSAVVDKEGRADEKTLATLKEDIDTIGSSLRFVLDFLQTMLDMYRGRSIKQVKAVRTNLLHDVFEPVVSMLSLRQSSVELRLECPEDLNIISDSLRLKDILLNLGRNATKFVSSGFVLFQVEIGSAGIELSVADSGPVRTGCSLFLNCLNQGSPR